MQPAFRHVPPNGPCETTAASRCAKRSSISAFPVPPPMATRSWRRMLGAYPPSERSRPRPRDGFGPQAGAALLTRRASRTNPGAGRLRSARSRRCGRSRRGKPPGGCRVWRAGLHSDGDGSMTTSDDDTVEPDEETRKRSAEERSVTAPTPADVGAEADDERNPGPRRRAPRRRDRCGPVGCCPAQPGPRPRGTDPPPSATGHSLTGTVHRGPARGARPRRPSTPEPGVAQRLVIEQRCSVCRERRPGVRWDCCARTRVRVRRMP